MKREIDLGNNKILEYKRHLLGRTLILHDGEKNMKYPIGFNYLVPREINTTAGNTSMYINTSDALSFDKNIFAVLSQRNILGLGGNKKSLKLIELITRDKNKNTRIETELGNADFYGFLNAYSIDDGNVPMCLYKKDGIGQIYRLDKKKLKLSVDKLFKGQIKVENSLSQQSLTFVENIIETSELEDRCFMDDSLKGYLKKELTEGRKHMIRIDGNGVLMNIVQPSNKKIL